MSEHVYSLVTVYRFGDFDLDVSSRHLMRAGQPIAIQPKPLELLMYLIRHRYRVVSREELLSELWCGVHVDVAALRFALHAVRRAVGDDGKRQAIIRTAQRAGFQFNAPVHEIASPVLGGEPRVEKRSPFLGREGWSREFESMLEVVGRGESRILMLSGGPDIGETRALERLLSVVGTLGLRVLHRHSVEADGISAVVAGAAEVGELESVVPEILVAPGGRRFMS